MVPRKQGKVASRKKEEMRLIYTVLPAKAIFNYTGPYYGTWHREDQEEYVRRYISDRNSQDNFYNNLTESIKRDGFLNPIIVDYGYVDPQIWNTEN